VHSIRFGLLLQHIRTYTYKKICKVLTLINISNQKCWMALNRANGYYRRLRKSVVFSWDLKDAEESTEQRLGLIEFHTDGTDMEKARDANLEFTAGLKN